jgi:hypothetical protein
MDSKIIVLFLATGLLFSAVLTSIISTGYAQQQQQQQQIPIPIPKSRSLKITYPTQGQQVPVGGNLTVKGTVNYGLATPLKGATAANTSSCHVIVQINQIPPYHVATGTGPDGQRDFSTWKYTVDPKSTPIKQGPDNKISARLSCPQSPNLETRVVTSFTGVGGTNSTSS